LTSVKVARAEAGCRPSCSPVTAARDDPELKLAIATSGNNDKQFPIIAVTSSVDAAQLAAADLAVDSLAEVTMDSVRKLLIA